jgi:hypothetical protein
MDKVGVDAAGFGEELSVGIVANRHYGACKVSSQLGAVPRVIGAIAIFQPDDPLDALLFGLVGCFVAAVYMWVIQPGVPVMRALWHRLERRILADPNEEEKR